MRKSDSAAPKTALVIGAAGGVGTSVARLLCSQGWHVIGTCRSAAQGDPLLRRGVCHRVLEMDLLDTESINRAFDELRAGQTTKLNALVNCAAITHSKPLEAEGIEELRRLFEVNLFSATRVIQLALPMLRTERGRIVLIGSTSGALGLPLLGAYSSAKFALEGLADALRRELASQNVAVSLVIPGGIRTPMIDKQTSSMKGALDGDLRDIDQGLYERYGSSYRQHRQLLLAADRLAVSPERVAEDVLKALQAARPQARYFCGLDQWALRCAIRLLPDAVWDELLPSLVDMSAGRWPERLRLDKAKEENPMHQLSSFDALMVFADSSRTPMHVSPFFIYDVSTAHDGKVRFKDILRVFEERLRQAPILRRKLLRVPFDLDNPYWVDDPNFDLEQHIRHVALPKPGDRRQLSILLARLTAYPMDLNRPAWDAYVIEGLDHVDGVPAGSFGLLLRIHHAAIDGQSGHAVLSAIHDLSATPEAIAPSGPIERAEPPSSAQMLARAYLSLWSKPGKLAKVVAGALPAMGRVKALKRESPAERRPVPVTRFAGKVSSHRVVSLVTVDMEGLRNARTSVEGATINDVVMTVVAGAMRSYLQAKGELPTQSMSAIMPMNIRTDADRNKAGNVVSLTTLNIHSNIADPLKRLRAIHASAVFSKAYHNAVGARVMSDVAASIPAGITSLGVRVASGAGLIDKVPGNTIVTNVPGPQQHLYMAGAKMIEFHAVGALLDGLGLFHAVNSYCGQISITVLADRQMMPDPAFYETCLRESHAQLLKATAPTHSPKAAQIPKKASKERRRASK